MNVKVILFAGAAVLALAACSKNEVVETNDHAIGFSNYAPKVVDGRADATFVNGNNLVSGQKFVVYGYNQKAADFSTTLNPTFMPGVEVTYKGGNTLETAGSNTYSPTRYWPKDEANNKLAFYAYYPVSTHVVPTVTEGLGSYAVTVDTDPSKNVDFLVADLVKDQAYSKTNKTGAVMLNFRHQLAKVQFLVNTNVTDENTEVTLNSLTVKEVKTTGTLTPAYGADFSTVWSDQADPKNFPVYSSDMPLSTTAVIKDTAHTYLMVPQTLGNDVVATVVYTYKTGSDEAVKNTVDVKLNDIVSGDAAITSWEKNNYIVYTFTIGLQPIKFAATVSAWDAEKDGNVVVL
ncbi:MAG: fimbrillin family protein [Bacteroidales bacterium]|jgi:hypothetical protein|nr:fimbrillin family protein [Bacteroidales bacterium]MCI2134834.1 fimbrillin family protein [Bacteroidales bacterium]